MKGLVSAYHYNLQCAFILAFTNARLSEILTGKKVLQQYVQDVFDSANGALPQIKCACLLENAGSVW